MKPQFQSWDDCGASETAQRPPGSFGVELPQESQSCGHFFFEKLPSHCHCQSKCHLIGH